MNACRAGSPRQKGFEARPFRPRIVVRQLMRDADDARSPDATCGDLPPELLHVNPLTRDQLLAAIRPLRKAGAPGVGAGDTDAHRWAALDADDHDVAALFDMHFDGSDDSRSQTLA